MPPVQTSYTSDMPKGLPGLVMNMEPYRLISRPVENGPLPFGAPASQGVGDTNCIPGIAGGSPYMGIAVVDPAARPEDDTFGFGTGDTALLIVMGVVWVTASVAVTPRQPAYYDETGLITNVATGGNTAIPGGSFDTTAAAGQIVRLRLRG